MSQGIVELSPSLRSLIDQRLDAIDGVLMAAGVPRGQRSGILGDVESHVFDLIHTAQSDSELSRRELLSILSRLDPPEAYAPEEYRVQARAAAIANQPPKMRSPKVSTQAVAGMILTALATFPMVGLMYVLAAMIADTHDQSALLLALTLGLVVFCLGAPGAILGVMAIRAIWKSDGWLYGIGCAVPAVALLPLIALQGMVAGCLIFIAEGMGLFLLGAAYIVAANAFALHGIWHWLSHGYTVRKPEVEHNEATEPRAAPSVGRLVLGAATT